MENNRQMRFLIPPFVLLASLLWGALVDPNFSLLGNIKSLSDSAGVSDVISIVLGGGVAVIASGFLISSVSLFLLRVFDSIHMFEFGHEAPVSSKVLDNILVVLEQKLNEEQSTNVKGQQRSKPSLPVVATFHHHIIPKPLSEWLSRRWNSFMVSVNSIVALTVSYLIGCYLNVKLEPLWIVPGIFLLVALVVNSRFAWTQTRDMLTFLSLYKWENGGQRVGGSGNISEE